MSAFGTWCISMAYPDMFTAIALCCGGGMPWNVGVLTMPVLAFRSEYDKVVLLSNIIDMIERLKKPIRMSDLIYMRALDITTGKSFFY